MASDGVHGDEIILMVGCCSRHRVLGGGRYGLGGGCCVG